MSNRLKVWKTYKLYIGGNFVRSESGRCLQALSPSGIHLDNYCFASRKDLRDAVAAARGAFEGWSRKTAYLRGQILYRAAEMLQQRQAELVTELTRSAEVSVQEAEAEIGAAVDRYVYYAGWTDKYSQVFSSINPVATPHHNFTMPEPAGVVVVAAPETPALLSLVSLVAPVVLSGNTVVLLASEKYPLPAITLCEILATSDFPSGVINVLTGKQGELAPWAAGHMDIDAIVDASANMERSGVLQAGAEQNLKRYTRRTLSAEEWFTDKAESPYWILDTVEFKTAWHPIGF